MVGHNPPSPPFYELILHFSRKSMLALQPLSPSITSISWLSICFPNLTKYSLRWDQPFLADIHVVETYTLSFHSLLDNNPLECDCGITPSLWTAEVTGTCAYPPHLRGVEVNTLYNEDFKCGLLDFLFRSSIIIIRLKIIDAKDKFNPLYFSQG